MTGASGFLVLFLLISFAHAVGQPVEEDECAMTDTNMIQIRSAPGSSAKKIATSAVPSDYVSWLSTDASFISMSGSTVVSITDKNPTSSIQVIGSPSFSTSDGFALSSSNHFRMMNVVGAGTWTVFVVFKTVDTVANFMGADPGGYGHFDTEVGFGGANNVFISGVNTGEFFMSTHHQKNGGVHSAGKVFADGEWHWVQIYGGDNPHKYSLLFDTGDYYENTDVAEGWMRDNEAFYVGRGQSADYEGYVKDVIVYNRFVEAVESAAVHAHLDALIGKVSTLTAVGDPHLKNIKKESFEVRKAGVHTLLNVPRGAAAGDALLKVGASMERLESGCSSLFMRSLDITGQWLGSVPPLRFAAGSVIPGEVDGAVLQVGNSSALSIDEFLSHVPASMITFTSPKKDIAVPNVANKHATLMMAALKFGPGVSMKVSWTSERTPSASIAQSLWVSVAGLSTTNSTFGGLLGEDDHQDAATPDADCTGKGPAGLLLGWMGEPPVLAQASLE